jgi:tyrosinase
MGANLLQRKESIDMTKGEAKPNTNSGLTRRDFLGTSVAAIGVAALPFGTTVAQGGAKYTRCNVMSEGGQRALKTYAKGVEAMLKLPADHPHNWFRNAFVHLMDCPHGNWWFYVWHRGFLGYFEQTIRALSKDDTFAIPYWDWTTLPQIPDSMFNGVLTPNDHAFEPYTANLAVFTSFIKPALESYWKSLNPAQLAQLKTRGYDTLDKMWLDVTGEMPGGTSENRSYAPTCGSRYLTRDNPKLDDRTAQDVKPFIVYSGLLAPDFYNPETYLSFNSSKTPSHNTQPTRDSFSVLEGLPHNKVHNYIGGVGAIDPGPYGCMTNNLSPIDPIFFLHHSNMDRLWDVWTRKQKIRNQPHLPNQQDMPVYAKEPFLFYVNAKGEYVGESHAGDYLDMGRWEYDYEPGGFGEKVVTPPAARLATPVHHSFLGAVRGNTASAAVPGEAVKNHLAEGLAATMFVQVTIPRSQMPTSGRDFDVIIGAPANGTEIGTDSPYYAGTISFFGGMPGMKGMAEDATFTIPLPQQAQAFHALAATRNSSVNIRLVPSYGHGQKAPTIKAASVLLR